MFWFRVELNEAGKVISCTQVAKATDGVAGGVFFYKAASGKAASERAYREYQRLRQVARRARYAAEGKCKCGRKRDGETAEQRARVECPACAKMHKTNRERAAAVAAGLKVAPIDKAARFVDRRTEERVRLLREVQARFQQSTMRNFGLWLAEEIARLEGSMGQRAANA